MVLCLCYAGGMRVGNAVGDTHGMQADALIMAGVTRVEGKVGARDTRSRPTSEEPGPPKYVIQQPSFWSPGLAHGKTSAVYRRNFVASEMPSGLDIRPEIMEFVSNPAHCVALKDVMQDGQWCLALDYKVVRWECPELDDFEELRRGLEIIGNWNQHQEAGRLPASEGWRINVSPDIYVDRRARERWGSESDDKWFVNVAGGSQESCELLAEEMAAVLHCTGVSVVPGPLLRGPVGMSDWLGSDLSHMPLSEATAARDYKVLMEEVAVEHGVADFVGSLTSHGLRRMATDVARSLVKKSRASKSVIDRHFGWADPGARQHKSADAYAGLLSLEERLKVTRYL